MIKYTVNDVVCDYGLYEDGELKLICNSFRNALLIKAIMEKDLKCSTSSDYIFADADYEKFKESISK